MTNQTQAQIEAAIETLKDAKNAAITSLYEFVDFVRTIDSELTPSEALIITGYVLHELPELFKKNPGLVNQIQEIATKLKLERSDISNS
ncbi:MAG: hypothetical protein RMX68_005820 [Aulosira sp. ZfuVER01]|nr:hypothetical protein [Aulosira sp. ZfuVER01]MDZ8000492.1 hypothetical protein [Aulosira sp. DedVER01a]MDZ8052964.1 hypothetical protein [Aulosira sp. ZfuCHP01]